jgi:O-palmitoleoyl-L-serine hydrolase
MSSKDWENYVSLHGIFDDESAKSPFYSANKVYVAYCTSDGWVGDAPSSSATWGYNFRGQRVIRSALNDLVYNGKLTSESSILLAGGSAGARGMMNNVDFLSSYLPTNSTLLGAFLDSPYYIDIEPYVSTFEGFPYETQQIYELYNVAAVIPPDCAKTYPGDQGWKCIYGQYRMPFLQTPYVLIASHFDSYQLNKNLGADPIDGKYANSDMDDYAADFAVKTKQSLLELYDNAPTNLPQGPALIHSWGCYNHDKSQSSGYYAYSSNGVTQYDATISLEDKVDKRAWIEECGGNFCGADCVS